MKTFIITNTKKSIKYGWRISINIYRVKNNYPEFLGSTEHNSGSYRGNHPEVCNWLVENKYLPKKARTENGYVNYDEHGKSFKIIEL